MHSLISTTHDLHCMKEGLRSSATGKPSVLTALIWRADDGSIAPRCGDEHVDSEIGQSLSERQRVEIDPNLDDASIRT